MQPAVISALAEYVPEAGARCQGCVGLAGSEHSVRLHHSNGDFLLKGNGHIYSSDLYSCGRESQGTKRSYVSSYCEDLFTAVSFFSSNAMEIWNLHILSKVSIPYLGGSPQILPHLSVIPLSHPSLYRFGGLKGSSRNLPWQTNIFSLS